MHIARGAFIFTSSLLGANSFSLPSPPRPPPTPKVHPMKTHSHEPIILSLPNILSTHQTSDMLCLIESGMRNGNLVSTDSYQEDIFSTDKWATEDTMLRSLIQPLWDDNLIPSEYTIHLEDKEDPNAALQAFVYAVTKHQDCLSEDNIIIGANIIQRRQAIERWKSEDGVKIMKLSLDHIGNDEGDQVDWDSISLGQRYELPPGILDELEQLVPRLIKGSWITRDATLVKYNEGDSQVPHVDPCDATLLICLKCDGGGDTCFPLIEPPLRLENREGSGILFFSSNKVTGDASRDTLSLHHGGKVTNGEKIVVQLMLDWNGDFTNNAGIPSAASWFDIIVDDQ